MFNGASVDVVVEASDNADNDASDDDDDDGAGS